MVIGYSTARHNVSLIPVRPVSYFRHRLRYTMATVLVVDSDAADEALGETEYWHQVIRQDFGALIELLPGHNDETRKVTITGSRDARMMASSLLKQLFIDFYRSETVYPWRLPVQPQKSDVDDSLARAKVARENAERDRQRRELLGPVVKDLYVEHSEVTAISDDDVDEYRLLNKNIIVRYADGGDNSRPIPKPTSTLLHAFHTYPKVLNAVEEQGITTPTPIQSQSWPIIMSGHDLIAFSVAKTGKTLLYTLPALIHVLNQPTPRENRIGPSVLILGLTRAIVLRITAEIKKFLFDGISVVGAHEGDPIENQTVQLTDETPDIVVATPGRLVELTNINAVDINHVSYLVFDEADSLLNMGFRTHLVLILKNVHPDKQTVLISSSGPMDIGFMIDFYAIKSLYVTTGTLELPPLRMIEQKVEVLKEDEKEDWLDKFFDRRMRSNDRIIIFMNQKELADKLYEKINSERTQSRLIYSGQNQSKQEKFLAEMRDGFIPILIIADIASCDIDIPVNNYIINYDFPLDIEEYNSRLKKAGRPGVKGSTYSLFTNKDTPNACTLIDVLKKSELPIPEELLKMASKKT